MEKEKEGWSEVDEVAARLALIDYKLALMQRKIVAARAEVYQTATRAGIQLPEW
jgi:hypothetical protein